ncbi:MAG TPA: O-sialoglycoprotein endopeptidase [Firmicutes bacterium]|nr:O-sialoglycoprotein endopeptidase [Bacillota bacterium]
MRVALGVDTSNYTTSLCLLAENGKIIADRRKYLKVASGSRGLRQSEALFQHIENLPLLTADFPLNLGAGQLAAVGVSVQPRPQKGSYLPVFLPGTSFSRALANIFSIPCYEFTHQEMHIWSGIASGGGPLQKEFLTVHLSGGTTELTFVGRREDWSLQVELWGGTSDLHAGQFLDRLGVKLGLDFPAGPALEQMAQRAQRTIAAPFSHREGAVSFSGPLTALERMVGQVEPEILAASCLQVLSRTLINWITWAQGRTECRDLLLVGGVAANSLIRTELVAALPAWNLYFAGPNYSVDNAYGAAYFAALKANFPVFPPRPD